MEYTAGNVYKAIDMLAPFGGCMAWDNVGLLVGEPDSAVTGILVTLDVTPAAVAQALEMRMNCIVSHHPIIFHPLKHISARDAAGLCLANGISVISAHTNYDFAPRGVNCALAQTLGLRNIRPFGPEDKEKPWYSIIVFVPKSHAEAVYRTMSEAGAGRQGNYSGCAYMNDGEGRFLPEAGAHPYLGKVGALEKAEETRLEMLCAPECLDAVIAAMRAAHPYEEPAYSILQNHALHRQEVYGMVGELPRPMRPEELAAGMEFFTLFTRKEAMMKASGLGFALPPRSFSVLEPCLYAGRLYHFSTLLRPGYVLSFAAGEPAPPELRVLEAEALPF